MELNFDKEMDALLRQAARGGEVVSAEAPAHLDADEISAFAENALPERARTLYTRHLADCDRCRSVLSNLILLNAETEAENASPVVAPVIAEAKTPWYRRLFAVPNLAYTLGGLVILFGGFLGFLVLQSTNNFQNTESLRVADDAPRASGPNVESGEPFSNSNRASVSNMANMSTNPAANTSIAESNMTMSDSNASTVTNTAPAVQATPGSPAGEKRGAQQLKTEEQTSTNQPKSEAKVKNKKDNVAAAQSAAKENEAVMLSPVPAQPPPAAMIDEAAGRTELSENQKARTLSKEDKKTAAASETTRQISGKTFNRRDGVWYDASFRGQETTNIRRGTDAYRKLEKGLRIIAESLEGTVVVVWKEKAYRIQ